MCFSYPGQFDWLLLDDVKGVWFLYTSLLCSTSCLPCRGLQTCHLTTQAECLALVCSVLSSTLMGRPEGGAQAVRPLWLSCGQQLLCCLHMSAQLLYPCMVPNGLT